MNSSSRIRQLLAATSLALFSLTAAVDAAESRLHFQRPGAAREQNERLNKNFRRPGLQRKAAAEQSSAPVIVQDKLPAKKRIAVAIRAQVEQPPVVAAKPLPKPKATKQKKVVRRGTQSSRNPQVARARNVSNDRIVSNDRKAAHNRPVLVVDEEQMRDEYELEFTTGLRLASHGCDICDGPCTCEIGCGVPEPSCGLYEPGCGIVEPSCGCGEPSCGICEPGCGLTEPSCGCGDVGCGSCVARPGPDYWCFPICLPRFKDLSLWGGVQGFRGPRDFANQRSDSNFGFHEGFNLSGRAPLVGLLFPQLSYQLGYQAMQSRLHGTATSTNDRSQQFVTAGFFRRVNTGMQFGVVWDLMEDDLDTDVDLHQIRYELSIKSPQGREIGFFGTNSTNDAVSLGTLYETVDQYALFYRWLFGNGYESRLWGGATGDGEGLFGGEFYAPLSSRWSVQSGFNYLITDEADGRPGVSQESWNIGINLVWHLGKTARRGCRSPFRPLFGVADNGWMFVDQAQ